MLSINLYKWSAFFSCLFLILSLNPFVLWLTWPPFINIPSYLLLFICGLALLKKGLLRTSKKRVLLFVLLFLFAFHINLPITSEYSDYGRAISFAAFLTIIFFPVEILVLTFKYFLKFHIWICIASLVVFFLAAITEVPHISITNSTAILQGTDYYYKLYGFIVSSTNTVYNIGGFSIGRICGIYPEPGHFATYISFLIIAQKLLFNEIHKVFFITGIFTFSPVFYITVSLLIGYNILIKRSGKSIRTYLTYMFLLICIVFFLGDVFQDQLWELAFGRNLTGGIEARLDERADQVALSAYHFFVKTSEVWVGQGVEHVENLGIFSDFRGFIFKYGILGSILSLSIVMFLIIKSKSFKYATLVLPFSALIYFQRSWMFGSVYIYFMLFMLLMFYLNERKKENF